MTDLRMTHTGKGFHSNVPQALKDEVGLFRLLTDVLNASKKVLGNLEPFGTRVEFAGAIAGLVKAVGAYDAIYTPTPDTRKKCHECKGTGCVPAPYSASTGLAVKHCQECRGFGIELTKPTEAAPKSPVELLHEIDPWREFVSIAAFKCVLCGAESYKREGFEASDHLKNCPYSIPPSTPEKP